MNNSKIISKYINTLSLPKDLKNILLSPIILKKNEFYINLTSYLHPKYSAIPIEKLNTLMCISFIYYQSLLFIDEIIDDKYINKDESKKVRYTLFAFELFEKAVKELTRLFPSKKDYFWNNFDLCKKNYIEANIEEKRISKLKTIDSLENYDKIAAGKSAFSNAIVYALNSISKNETVSDSLLKCLDLFHIGLQHYDDLTDFRKDLSNGQYTYAQHLTKLTLTQSAVKKYNNDEFYKYLFLTGAAIEILKHGKTSFIKSYEIASSFNLRDLCNHINGIINKCDIIISEIEGLIYKTEIKARRSQIRVKPDYNINVKDRAQHAIKKGITFLENTVEDDGLWSDFLTTAGFSKIWISAYIGLNMAEMNFNYNLLNPILNYFQRENQYGYNKDFIDDGDSMNFIMGFKNKCGLTLSSKEKNRWLKFMNNNGGWQTYIDKKGLENYLKTDNNLDVTGWLSPKTCVTAAAAYILADFTQMQFEFHKTADYLQTRISEEGSCDSYWWTSPIYSTAYTLMAFVKGNLYPEMVKKLSLFLISKQDEHGYWVDPITKSISPFYSALATKALIYTDKNKYFKNIFKSVKWLLENQMSDGSWQTTRILQIPSPNIENITKIKNWRKSSFGTNIIVDDHNRCFSTSIIINCLFNYINMN